MSRHLKMEEFELIFNAYEEVAIKIIHQISSDTIHVKRKKLAVGIKKIIKHYNLGMKENFQQQKVVEDQEKNQNFIETFLIKMI